MKENKFILGIDTSNYTTSVALLTLDGELKANVKMLLPVKEGERGLRQSDALFHHTAQMPKAMREIRELVADGEIVTVGVSERPRNVEGSYMPCFLCGVSIAEAVSVATGASLQRFSHQCGHIMAAVYSSGAEHLLDREFMAFHISGGTTELLRVKPCYGGFKTEIIGGTLDLNAGQVIDRIGVAMGLSFPSGREMETLALEYDGNERARACVKGRFVNLSGLENQAINLFNKISDKAKVSSYVFHSIGYAIAKICISAIEEFGEMPIVFAGGVMCNSIVRKYLCEGLRDVYFAEPALSSDNAVGIAELARRAHVTK